MKKLAILSLLVVLSFGCKQNDDIEYTVYSCVDHSIAQDMFVDVFKVMHRLVEEYDEYRHDNCIDHLDTNTVGFPLTIVADFGTDECESQDLRERKGEIYFQFSNKWSVPGCMVSISPNGYRVDDYQVSGVITITNQGDNSQGNQEIGLEVVGGQIKSPDNTQTISWNCDLILEWDQGAAGSLVEDDAWLITGTASGSNRNSTQFEAEVTTPVRCELVCRWMKEGAVEVIPYQREIRELDFGLGDCNELATVYVGGKNYTITLP